MAVFSAGAKIIKPSGEKADEFELSISQALLELEINSELKSQLRELFITGAKDIDVGGNKKAIVIFVPVPQLRAFQKVQSRLVRELEKKFSGKHVVFVAQRRILPKPTRKSRTKNKQKRPRSRTLTAVHDAILEDLVFPSEIVGKRIRVKLDGTRIIKVHLDKSQQIQVDYKTDTFSAVYKKLTGKDVLFEFPDWNL
ncbi:40S ribosomal protein S7-like [Patiria miniata]|uniref:40S ribosomal protein S7 n=1 Tax=Patiria miniata TaxID=46514 RepID=A0A914A1A0_PATMI|nr:40S ribosomal protein S7-like [Patiria miniata]